MKIFLQDMKMGKVPFPNPSFLMISPLFKGDGKGTFESRFEVGQNGNIHPFSSTLSVSEINAQC